MSDRARLARRLAPAAVVLALAVAWLVPDPDWTQLASPDPEAAERMAEAVAALGEGSDVLLGYDPDLGTYAEVRPTARALVDELLGRGASLSVVSVTPEGRALAVAEIERLARDGANVTDRGFISGAEAGLVDVAREAVETAYDAIVVVGGNDIGPRSWIEQVVPRIEAVPVLAVTPTVLLPEVQPYLASGQLQAALTTPRDGAAYRADVAAGDLGEVAEPSSLALIIGMLLALAVLGQALAARVAGGVRSVRSREAG